MALPDWIQQILELTDSEIVELTDKEEKKYVVMTKNSYETLMHFIGTLPERIGMTNIRTQRYSPPPRSFRSSLPIRPRRKREQIHQRKKRDWP